MASVMERKHTYWKEIVEHRCKCLQKNHNRVVLFHEIKEAFQIPFQETTFTIGLGTYTTAFYWKDRPYNVYVWRNHAGDYVGSYFNFVRETHFTKNTVEYLDLIVDVLVLPNQTYHILDLDEPPHSLDIFENGTVQRTLQTFLKTVEQIIFELLDEIYSDFPHHALEWRLNR